MLGEGGVKWGGGCGSDWGVGEGRETFCSLFLLVHISLSSHRLQNGGEPSVGSGVRLEGKMGLRGKQGASCLQLKAHGSVRVHVTGV